MLLRYCMDDVIVAYLAHIRSVWLIFITVRLIFQVFIEYYLFSTPSIPYYFSFET